MRFSVQGKTLSETPADFKTAKETLTAPLAKKLFGFPWTAGVFIGRDFLTVTKQEWVDWQTLAEPLCELIKEHLERNEPVILQMSTGAPNQEGAGGPANGAQGTLNSKDSGNGINTSSASGATSGNNNTIANSSDSAEVALIKKVLNEEIRPAVAMDGGDITFDRYEDQVVYLRLQGSCAGCPSSTMTLKQGVESRLRQVLPEIKEVVSI
jgi:Fe-S cluster biogenesis protein NfuA